MDRTCKITLRDEVNCNIQGLTPDHRNDLVKKWSIMIHNAYFMPAFKQGKWDGKIKYVKDNGNTYINILDEIVPWIIDNGYTIEVDDRRPSHPQIPELIDKNLFIDYGIELRWYQVDAINAAIENNAGLLRLGTGAGKTYINAGIAKAYETVGLRSLTIVPNTDLVLQTAKKWKKIGLDVGVFYGKKKEPNKQHMISTWQSLKNNRDLVKEFDVIVVDEVHNATATVLNEILTQGHGPKIPFRFGLTGTVPKEKSSKLTLQTSLGEVLYNLPAADLIKAGYLSALGIKILQLQDKIAKLQPKKKLKDVDEKEKAWKIENQFLVKNRDRNNTISKIIEMQQDGKGNSLVLVDSVEQGKFLADLLDCTFIWGDTDTDVRAKEYDEFEHTEGKILIATYGIAKAGIDITNLHNVFLIDAKRAFTRVIQSIGRGLRKGGNKWFVNIFDICSNSSFSVKQMEERMKYYDEEGYPHELIKVEVVKSDITFGEDE